VIFAGEVQGLRIMFCIQFCELTCYKIELVDILIAVERQVDSISSIFNDGNKFTINKSYNRSKKVKSGLSNGEIKPVKLTLLLCDLCW
jgi:hypothetical protein